MPKVVAEYKAQARARIVNAAQAVFRRKGFTHSTMGDVAKEIGVSKGALYLYFPTKLDLLVAIQKGSREDALRSWESLLSRGDVADGLAGGMDAIFSGEVDPSFWLQLVAESASDPKLRSALEIDQREDIQTMRRFLERLAERGRIPPLQNAPVMAEVILMLFHGSLARVILGGQPKEVRRKLVRGLKFVLNG
jgi:AcrR family transcriptional regulator